MSRPSSFHDGERYEEDPFDPSGFSLPLFNPHQTTIPPYRSGQLDGQVHPPPPSSSGHQHRHSVNYGSNMNSEFNSSAAAPHTAGLPQSQHRQHQSMASTLPYSTLPYPQTATGAQHVDELMPPASTSASFGSLARSASLGARKKDPYSYSSDDVESGLGNVEVRGESSNGWPGYGGGRQAAQVHAPPPQSRDIPMSPTKSYGNNNQMNPPPIPAYALTRPPPARNDSGGSSPSRATYTHEASYSMPSPYVPRGSDPGPSTLAGQTQWAEYRRPQSNQRVPSAGMYQSSPTEQLSAFLKPDTLGASPQSPLLNPYDVSPNMAPAQTISPNPSAQSRWGRSQIPTSPRRGHRSHSSHQLYPASQPVTPASKTYGMGPPRATMPSRERSRSGISRQGLTEVKAWKDLVPMVTNESNGRRADPDLPGKYLSPLKCLTAALPQTFTLCNPQFRYETSENPRRVLTKPSKPAHNDGADNDDWDYILYVNDVLGGEQGGDRYLILDVLGQGTFGQVVKCQNMRTHDICAVKVVKNKPAYLNQSKMEVAILDLLNQQYDPGDAHHILRMLESFTHKSHLCLVFECLSSNLYELIKQNQFKGLSTQLVKVFTQQLLECLAVLKDARLIHCDLKPENILLKSLQSPQIKVIDFGSACHEMQTVYTYIQSRFYRSPEVLLGLPYSASIDMWSLGCIVVELFLGLPLFPGTSEYNQVSRIVDMLGNPPHQLLEVGKQTNEFFNCIGVDHHGRKQYQLKPMDQYASEHRTQEQPSKQYFNQTELKDIIMEYQYSKKNPKQSDIDKEMGNRRAFVDFVEGLLNLDPIKRWSPQQAAKHPFITGEKFTGKFEPPSAPSKKQSYSTAPPEVVTPSSSSKKYGGLVQSPSSNRGQRIYSDAAAYNQQLAQHQSYTAQVHSASSTPRQGPFSPGYDLQQQAYAQQQRVLSQQHQSSRTLSQSQRQTMAPPQNYQQRVPSQGVPVSASHASTRGPNTASMMVTSTNPPPNTYYPPSRNRANTINEMDAIPPALARLTHFGAPDPSGTRNLTPVMNRDDAIREWERRQQGHSKKSSLHNASYPQLEYLQEQAELAAMGGQSWMMPGQYGPAQTHRSQASASIPAYQMQPPIGVSPQHDYRARPSASEYEPQLPPSASSSRSYLPAYPPPAATSVPNTATFDAFDTRDSTLGMMYTPLQPNQAGYHQQGYPGGFAGHQARASYSGPYNGPNSNPFAQQAQSGPTSPRYHRRSQGYGA